MAATAAQNELPAFLARLEQQCEEAGARPDLMLSEAIGEIDRRMEAQVDAILHHPTFRRLEAAWNSLEYLISIRPEDDLIRLRALNASRDELLADFEDAMEFDQSAMFHLVYEEEDLYVDPYEELEVPESLVPPGGWRTGPWNSSDEWITRLKYGVSGWNWERSIAPVAFKRASFPPCRSRHLGMRRQFGMCP